MLVRFLFVACILLALHCGTSGAEDASFRIRIDGHAFSTNLFAASLAENLISSAGGRHVYNVAWTNMALKGLLRKFDEGITSVTYKEKFVTILGSLKNTNHLLRAISRLEEPSFPLTVKIGFFESRQMFDRRLVFSNGVHVASLANLNEIPETNRIRWLQSRDLGNAEMHLATPAGYRASSDYSFSTSAPGLCVIEMIHLQPITGPSVLAFTCHFPSSQSGSNLGGAPRVASRIECTGAVTVVYFKDDLGGIRGTVIVAADRNR